MEGPRQSLTAAEKGCGTNRRADSEQVGVQAAWCGAGEQGILGRDSKTQSSVLRLGRFGIQEDGVNEALQS